MFAFNLKEETKIKNIIYSDLRFSLQLSATDETHIKGES
jgi:hypothetical protein